LGLFCLKITIHSIICENADRKFTCRDALTSNLLGRLDKAHE